MKRKTEETIRNKRALKFFQLKKRAELTTKQTIRNIAERINKVRDYRIEKQEKKLRIYLNKKELEYKRKCENEIRELKGKPQREYKQKPWTRNKILQFALEIAQENSRLRDSDADGNGYCISCNKYCTWDEHAG